MGLKRQFQWCITLEYKSTLRSLKSLLWWWVVMVDRDFSFCSISISLRDKERFREREMERDSLTKTLLYCNSSLNQRRYKKEAKINKNLLTFKKEFYLLNQFHVNKILLTYKTCQFCVLYQIQYSTICKYVTYIFPWQSYRNGMTLVWYVSMCVSQSYLCNHSGANFWFVS